jgi:nucleotide-binding universal stress UspA family protein
MTLPIHSLVVGVADLDRGDPVLRYGVELSERLGATLHVVHAYSPPDVLPETEAETGDADRVGPPIPFPATGEGIELERPLRERLSRLLPESLPGSRVVPHFVAGSPARALQQAVEETGAELVLVGAHRGGGTGVLLGTTAARTVRGASVPALVLREPPRRPGARVLLTTDLSEVSRRACEAGLELARALFGDDSVQLRCLLAVYPGSGDLPPYDPDRLRATAEPSLHRFVRDLSSSGTPVAGVVRTGVPEEEILSEATEWPADLVVMGTHGRSGISRLLLGSVAETALRDLRTSVLVVPARTFESDTEP